MRKVHMKVFAPRWLSILLLLAVGGCQHKTSPNRTTPVDMEADISANLARLGPEDQQLAMQQKYCPMMDGVRLGEMGRPRKVTVKGVSVFVCCENCVRAALEDPEAAITRITELQKTRARDLPDGATPATTHAAETAPGGR
jgi:hypothetical protein